jgi:serine/threonine protein kinase
VFSLDTLIEATGKFHEGNKLGEGGFGPIYKGITSDGIEIAVKKLSLRSAQGTGEFMNEINLVAKIQHRNLVKLLGFCVDGPERLLVYEYKSLDTFLFNPERRKVLDWQKRYNIIIGIARGLLYLHVDSQVRIIHRDVKANNILLNIIDPIIVGRSPQEQTLRCIHVGLLCVQADVANRPAMTDVVSMLSTNSVAIPNPTKPAFVSLSFIRDANTKGRAVTALSAPLQIQRSSAAFTGCDSSSIISLEGR